MLVVGTWNLENLFKPGSEYGPSAEVYGEKLDGLAQVINNAAPDVLAVQEVGDPDALDDWSHASRATGTSRSRRSSTSTIPSTSG